MNSIILKYAPETTEAEQTRTIAKAELWYEGEADMSRMSGGDKTLAVAHYALWTLTGDDSHMKIARKNLPRTDPRKLFTCF